MNLPHGIALDSSNNLAYVSSEGDGTVSMIDTSNTTVLPDTIAVGTSPLIVVVLSGANKVYVYNAGSGTLSVINTISDTVIATVSL